MASELAHVAMNTLLWEAAVMLLVIGFVKIGDIFGATVAAAFIVLLWALGLSLTCGGGNRIAINHAVWFTCLLFVLFTAFTLQLGHLTLSIALGILAVVCFGLSIANYTGNHVFGKGCGSIILHRCLDFHGDGFRKRNWNVYPSIF